MVDKDYQLIEIETGRTPIPRALILCLENGRPTAVYQVDIYGYEFPPDYAEASDIDMRNKLASEH